MSDNKSRNKDKDKGKLTTFPFFCLAGLHSREETRTRIAIELHTLNVNIAIVFWAPELE
jgi:hypothetical protein